jgi:hypothetical protein
LLQCSFVLLLNFFDISIKTMQCLFIQVNGWPWCVKMQTQSLCKLESRLGVWLACINRVGDRVWGALAANKALQLC